MTLYTSKQQRSGIDLLWEEFKVANQFPKTWERAVDNVELIRRKEMSDTLPTQDDLTGLLPPSPSSGTRASYWMQQVDMPRWFLYEELGLGSATNIMDTTANLAKTNARRRGQYQRDLDNLAKARKASIISRQVYG